MTTQKLFHCKYSILLRTNGKDTVVKTCLINGRKCPTPKPKGYTKRNNKSSPSPKRFFTPSKDKYIDYRKNHKGKILGQISTRFPFFPKSYISYHRAIRKALNPYLDNERKNNDEN
jgi:hypothetical protein